MFDKEFDKSLWLILESDLEERKEIIDFLKSIPEDFLKSIKEDLKLTTTTLESCGDIERKMFALDGTVYSYEIEYPGDEKSLVLKHELAEPNDREVDYMNFSTELTLSAQNPFISFDWDDEYYVGNFTKTGSMNTKKKFDTSLVEGKIKPFMYLHGGSIERGGYMEEQELEYDLLNGEEGYTIRRSSLDGNEIHLPIDMSKLPDEITMDYIDQNYGDSSKIKKFNPSK